MIYNKKGFTLIELLAVIVILGIVIVITIPLINILMKNSQMSTFKSSIQSIVKITQQQTLEYRLTGELTELTLSYNNRLQTIFPLGYNIDFEGKKPEHGKLVIREDGKVKLALYDDGFCAVKNYNDKDIEVFELTKEQCSAKIN